MPDFVVIGDVTQDNFFFIEDASVHEGELDLKYGSKIPVEKYAVSLGGNAANVSVGLARLGIQTALVTTFGDDERGAWIKKKLMENNVDIAACQNDPKIQSNISSVIVFKNERTILSYHNENSIPVRVQPCQWAYLTSGAGYQSMPGVKIAYNPWLKDIKENLPMVKQILADTEVLIVNTEEAEALGVVGPKITVITDGKNGARVFENGKLIFEKPTVATEIVEVTGAGDAFSSGFLAALFYQKDLATALDWGLKNSASVISKVGAIEGLLCLKNI